MGDATSGSVRLSFNPQLRVEFRGAPIRATGHNRQFPLPDLLRQSIYSRLAGYEDTNDAERLAEDPTFRMLASRERRETSVALTSTLHWFETDVLAEERNCQGLARLNTAMIQHADRYRARGQTVVVRADAAFALPALYEALERREVRYAIRLPANDVLERRIEDLLTRPRGRPSYAPLVRYRSFEYQAASWDRPRRVIAKIEDHLAELFPRVGFIVTTLTGTNRAVVRFYNQRGTAEQLAESYLTGPLLRQILARIERLAWHPM